MVNYEAAAVSFYGLLVVAFAGISRVWSGSLSLRVVAPLWSIGCWLQVYTSQHHFRDFSPRSFGHLRKSLRQHQDSWACVEKIRVDFGRVPASLRDLFKTSDRAQLKVLFICLIPISNTQFCLVKFRKTTNFQVFVAQLRKLQFIADSRRDEKVYCCNCFRDIDKLIYCIFLTDAMLFLCFLLVAAFPSGILGQTEWGFKKYTKYETGSMNLIITVPHGAAKNLQNKRTEMNGSIERTGVSKAVSVYGSTVALIQIIKDAEP